METTTEIDSYVPPTSRATRLRVQIMFYVAGLFLVCLSVILRHGTASDQFSEALMEVTWFWPWTFAVLWGIILAEGVIGMFQAPDGFSKGYQRFLWVVFIPPLRMVFSPSRPNKDIWFARSGWLPVSKESSEVMELVLAIPMLLDRKSTRLNSSHNRGRGCDWSSDVCSSDL